MVQNNRVLFLGHNADRAGAPLLLLELIKWLSANSSIDPSVLLKFGGELENEYAAVAPTRNLVNEFYKYEDINRAFHRRILRKLQLATKQHPDLTKFYPFENYPVIYANTIATCDLAQQFTGPRRYLIHHVHELSYATDSFGMTESLKKAVSKTNAYIAASGSVRDFLERKIGVPAAKIHLIHEFPIATDKKEINHEQRNVIRRQLGIAGNAFVVGMCGSADWRKGADIFVQLALQMKSQFGAGQCHFVWLGGNSDDHRMASHDITRAGLLDVCHFVRAVPNPEAYFSVFEVFALTSREDPFPVAMLEAASFGLPIVCFAGSGGGPELVEEDAGIVVPYLDVAAMAKACMELFKDEDRRKALGKKVRAKVQENYRLSIQGPKIRAVIEAAMG